MSYFQLSIITIFGFVAGTLSTFMKYNIYRLNQNIAKQLSDLNKNVKQEPEVSSLDIETLVKIEQNFYSLRDRITSYVQKYVEFLDEISAQNSNLIRIEQINIELTNLRQEAEKLFTGSLAVNPRTMYLWGNFVRIFLFRTKLFGTIKKRIDILEDKIKSYKQEDKLFYELNLMFTEKSTIIQLGAGMDNLGRIMNVNVGASILTKYSIQELLSLNVCRIMTRKISVHHQDYLLRAYKKGEFSIMYREQRNFVVDKLGFATPISLLVKPMYDVSKQLFQYISYIQPVHTNSSYILTDSEGVIETMGDVISNLLGISPKQFGEGKISIQSVLPFLLNFFIEKRISGQGEHRTVDVAVDNPELHEEQPGSSQLPEERSHGFQSPPLCLR